MGLRRTVRLLVLLALTASASIALPISADAREQPAADYGEAGTAYVHRPGAGWQVDYIEQSAIDPSGGQLIVNGGNWARYAEARPFIYRLDPTGTTDTTFGTAEGVHRLGDGFGVWGVEAGLGGIVVFGQQSTVVGEGDAARLRKTALLVRLGLDGRPDERFGPGGRVELDVDGSSVPAAVVAPDGSVVYQRDVGDRSSLLRIGPDGQPDATFGEVALDPDAWYPALATTTAGRVIVADNPYCEETFNRCTRVRRLTSQGTFDPTFGSGGETLLLFSVAADLLVSPVDGSILVPGADYFGHAESYLWKLTPSGRVDRTFGRGGRARVADVSFIQGRHPVAWLSTGEIALIGSTEEAWTDRIVVLRPDGTLDPAFGTGGVREQRYDTTFEDITAHDERIYVSVSGGSPASRITAFDLDIDATAPRVSSVEQTGGRVDVRWEAARSAPTSAVQAYRVVILGEGGVRLREVTVGPRVRRGGVNGIPADWTYDVVVEAVLRSGEVRTSPVVAGVRGPALAERPAFGHFRKASFGDGWMTLSWRPPIDDGGAPITAYSIVAIDPDTDQVAAWRNVPGDVRTATLTGLANGVRYELHAIAWNRLGPSALDPWPPTIATVADGDTPAPPVLVWRDATRSGSTVTATWSEPVELGQVATGFDVVVVVGGKIVGWARAGLGDRQAVLRDVPSGPAQVYVFVRTAEGFGPIGSPVPLG